MVSIKDVARLAGVSTATVSRTLAEPELVAEKTREKVLEVIRESGYVANTLARNFRTRRSNTVLVLVPHISNPFFSEIIHGIEAVAHDYDYRILLGETQEDLKRERAYAKLVLQRQADGIILLGRSIPFAYSPKRKKVDPNWPPIALACEYNSDIALPTVRIDNVAAGEEATTHLAELGHRRIAYINGPKDSPLCQDRSKGYKRALRKAGIKVDSRLAKGGDYSLRSGVDGMNALLKEEDRPTAVFAANDEMAIGAIQAIRTAGLSVPADISVVGFDDIRFAEYCSPPLTTIHQPRTEIGRQVMQIMFRLLNGERVKEHVIVLPHQLIVRESTHRVCPTQESTND